MKAMIMGVTLGEASSFDLIDDSLMFYDFQPLNTLGIRAAKVLAVDIVNGIATYYSDTQEDSQPDTDSVKLTLARSDGIATYYRRSD